MLRKANRDAAQVVVNKARPNVPVRTGRLRSTLRATGSQRAGSAIAGRAAVRYAAATHWGRLIGNVGSPPGNRKGPNIVKGRPFLLDAKNAVIPQIVEEYRAGVGRVMAAARLRGS